MTAADKILALSIGRTTGNSGRCRKRSIRLHNRIFSPDGYSAVAALLVLAAIVVGFVRAA